MKTVEATFFPTEEHPELGLGLSVFLGSVDDPALASLAEGEHIFLVEPNELQAEAVARHVRIPGLDVWFGEINSREAIQVIHSDTTDTHAKQAS